MQHRFTFTSTIVRDLMAIEAARQRLVVLGPDADEAEREVAQFALDDAIARLD